MLPWFVKTCLILAWDFAGVTPADMEIDNSGRIWVLSALEPAVYRIYPTGERDYIELEDPGPFSGLALSPGGRWAVTSRSAGLAIIYSDDDIVTDRLEVQSPGDLVFNGMDLWVVSGSTGDIVSPWNGVIARDCCGWDSRLSKGSTGDVLASGAHGVYLIILGDQPERLAGSGSACFAGDSILIETDTRVTSSPAGDMVIRWGNGTPEILE